jgi:hypothetical protein
LLSLAVSSISLLTLPQMDSPSNGLPQSEERSEPFALEVSEYSEHLDVSCPSILTSCRSIDYCSTCVEHTMTVNSGRDPVSASAHSTFLHRTICHQCPAAGPHPTLPGRRAPLYGWGSHEKKYGAAGAQSRETHGRGSWKPYRPSRSTYVHSRMLGHSTCQ